MRCRLPFQFIEIPENSLFRVRKRLSFYCRSTDGVLIDHFFHFLYMKPKIILNREVGKEYIGLHLRIDQVVPTWFFGFVQCGKVRIFKGKRTGRIKCLILCFGIFQTEFSLRFWAGFFAARDGAKCNTP